MSGENVSPKAKIEELVEISDRLLNEYSRLRGIDPELEVSNEAEKYLKLTSNELKQLTVEDCMEGAYLLESLAFYLQKEINKEQGRQIWASKYLPIMVATEVDSYKGYSYEERKNKVIKNNVAALKVYEVQTKAEQRISRLNYLVNRISKVGDTLKEIRLMKVKHE